MSKEEKELKISGDKYLQLLKKYETTLEELDVFKTKSPLVGVRWFGSGGFKIGLSHPINGVNSVLLHGYNDKAVIDLPAWHRIGNTEAVHDGVIVRDDSVVKELGLTGVVAPIDKIKSENAFLDDEIRAILKKGIPILKATMKKITNQFAAKHFLDVMDLDKNKDLSKRAVIEGRRDELLTYHRYSLLHHHDLTSCCETFGIEFKGLTDAEMIVKLAKKELSSR